MTRTDEHGQPVGDPVPGWTPRPHPVPVRLAGRYVVLEPLATAHESDLLATLCAQDDDALWTYRPTPRPVGPDALHALLAAFLVPDRPTWVFRPVAGPLAGRACGMSTWMRIEPEHGQVEVAAVLLARALQRTTAATEAQHLLMRHAFDDLGYRRYEWKCDSLNAPSQQAALRLGFTYEGRFRRHLVTRGRNRDTDWFSITDAEWPGVRAAHEAWLDPAHHDEAGRQRGPLATPGLSARRARLAAWTSD